MHLVACTQVVLNELAQGLTQRQIALTYAMAIRSEAAGADRPDWRTINMAIAERWPNNGLKRVKKRAWDFIDGKDSPNGV